ncbi:MAG: hypothetical protein WBB39_01780 [Candidatus Saccharimonadales bacterium]
MKRGNAEAYGGICVVGTTILEHGAPSSSVMPDIHPETLRALADPRNAAIVPDILTIVAMACHARGDTLPDMLHTAREKMLRVNLDVGGKSFDKSVIVIPWKQHIGPVVMIGARCLDLTSVSPCNIAVKRHSNRSMQTPLVTTLGGGITPYREDNTVFIDPPHGQFLPQTSPYPTMESTDLPL